MIRNCKEVTLSGKQYEIDDTSGCINKSSPCLVDLGRADCGDCPPLKSSVAMASPVGTGDYDDDLQRANVTSCIGEEIPVWIRGEVRWISGVTYETTCTDIIQALLTAEGIQTSAGVDELNTPELSDFVITERWREMEQVLDGNMSILKIWMAWGETQSEVKYMIFNLCLYSLQFLCFCEPNDFFFLFLFFPHKICSNLQGVYIDFKSLSFDMKRCIWLYDIFICLRFYFDSTYYVFFLFLIYNK